jgi:hypothetical protein
MLPPLAAPEAAAVRTLCRDAAGGARRGVRVVAGARCSSVGAGGRAASCACWRGAAAAVRAWPVVPLPAARVLLLTRGPLKPAARIQMERECVNCCRDQAAGKIRRFVRGRQVNSADAAVRMLMSVILRCCGIGHTRGGEAGSPSSSNFGNFFPTFPRGAARTGAYRRPSTIEVPKLILAGARPCLNGANHRVVGQG